MTKCHPSLGTEPTVSDQRLKFTKSRMEKLKLQDKGLKMSDI